MRKKPNGAMVEKDRMHFDPAACLPVAVAVAVADNSQLI